MEKSASIGNSRQLFKLIKKAGVKNSAVSENMSGGRRDNNSTSIQGIRLVNRRLQGVVRLAFSHTTVAHHL